jgi:hypothetical protein
MKAIVGIPSGITLTRVGGRDNCDVFEVDLDELARAAVNSWWFIYQPNSVGGEGKRIGSGVGLVELVWRAKKLIGAGGK